MAYSDITKTPRRHRLVGRSIIGASVLGILLVSSELLASGVIEYRQQVYRSYAEPPEALSFGPAPLSEAAIQKIRADYLFHLLSFVEWPETTDFNKHQQIHVCMIGGNSLGEALYTLQKRRLGNKSIAVHISYGAPESTPCHIAYVGGKRRPFSDNVVQKLGSRNILTVGDSELFVRGGGMIGLIVGEHKVWCGLNMQAANAANFRFSAQFLELASVVVQDFQ